MKHWLAYMLIAHHLLLSCAQSHQFLKFQKPTKNISIINGQHEWNDFNNIITSPESISIHLGASSLAASLMSRKQ